MPTREVAPELGRIYPPAAGARTWVPRRRLLDTMRGLPDAPSPPIVLVSAPAGAGKSVLARQWLEFDDRAQLEIPVTAGLDEPSALSRALVQVLERVGPAARNLRASITSTEPRFSTILLPGLARLAASRTEPYVLVVDDVHLLRHRACHDVLLAVCAAMPPGSQVILLTREEAPPWLARSRAEGRLLEVRAHDLRFDVDEAAALFHGMDALVPGLDVADVVARTEGWAVGLYLTGLTVQHHDGTPTHVVPGGNGDSDRFIADYISDQVLLPLDPELQVFALRTSVLDELSTGLCDAVLERDDSVAVLGRLREQLQLVIPVDAGGARVRYHHLLADALRAELWRRWPAEVPLLHARASHWYAEAGQLDEAIRHAKAGGDLAEVGRLVWSGSADCIGSGDKDRLAFWLADLSENEVAHDRWLTLAAAWVSLQSGETDRMERWILRAERHAGVGWESRVAQDPYPAHLAVLVAIVAREGLAHAEALSDDALQGLPVDSQYRTAALFTRGVALTMARRFEPGRHSLVEAERLARALHVPIIQADALSWQGVIALAAGDTASARRLIAGAQDVIRANRLERLATAAHSITAQSLLQALRNDPDAMTTLTTARRLTTQLEDVVPWFAVCGRLIQARAAVSLGEGALARQLVTEAKARLTPALEDSLAQDLLTEVERSIGTMTIDGVTSPALTAAEMRVLQFLPSHLQLPQIGEHLFVSSNTVKTHVMAIHRKLGVTSRDQAVARARELGLLEAPAHD